MCEPGANPRHMAHSPAMSVLFGLHVRFRTLPDRADELEAILLEAAETAGATQDCLLYVVGRSPEDPTLVWVMETWTDRDAHDASLADPAARRLIERARPLLDGPPQTTELRPSGGKGL